MRRIERRQRFGRLCKFCRPGLFPGPRSGEIRENLLLDAAWLA